jgi:flagella basal body P-ring formation protein FlgA
MQRITFAIIACLATTLTASATEITLREQATPQASIVRLGDVAEITGADAVTIEHLAATPLMPAPSAGSSQFVRVAELRDLLAARGLDVRNLRISGAEVVAIGPAVARTPVAPARSNQRRVAANAASTDASLGVSADQLTAAITEYLRRRTGHDLWNVKLDADRDAVAAFQQAGAAAVINGGKAPWTGRQRFAIVTDDKTPSVLAYARIERLEMAAFMVRSIERGALVRRADVEFRPFAGALPRLAVISLDEVIGKEAVQGIRADSLLLANQVRAPLLVRRGERVSVRARAGGITVRTYAIVQQDGALGDLVSVQTVEGKERYSARVSGLRELEVFAAGASATEVAAAPTAAIR